MSGILVDGKGRSFFSISEFVAHVHIYLDSNISFSNNASVLMPQKLREMDDVIKMVHLNGILSSNSKQGDTLLVCSYLLLLPASPQMIDFQ